MAQPVVPCVQRGARDWGACRLPECLCANLDIVGGEVGAELGFVAVVVIVVPVGQDADLTASQGETGHEDQYETDFNRWLDSLSPGQREQITRDIEAAHDLIRAEAWDEAVDTLSGPWEDMIPAQIADLDRRNPYRKEQP